MQIITFHPVGGEHPLDTVSRMVGGRAVLANKLGVTAAAVGNWKSRGAPIEKCVEIERYGSPVVTRRDLRPDDWQKIWPELATAHESTQQAATQPVAHGA